MLDCSFFLLRFIINNKASFEINILNNYFLATYGWGGGVQFDPPAPLAKISGNDAIHLKLGTLIL